MAIETAKFTTTSANLRLVRQPGVPNFNALGRQQGFLQKSLVYEFQALGHRYGVLELRKGQDKLADGPLDEETGEPTVQDAIDWIRSLPSYNVTGTPDGFVEDGREPGRVPAPNDELDDIQEAIVARDVERLQEILDAERSGYAREIVVQQAERGIARVQKALASKPGPKPKAKTEE